MSFALPKERFIYQFGDPLNFNLMQGYDCFVFPTDELTATTTLKNKTMFTDNPFGNGQINNIQKRAAFQNPLEFSVKFAISAGFDFDYLKSIFLGRTKKVFFLEYDLKGIPTKVFVNYATCTGGLEGGTQIFDKTTLKTVDLSFVYSNIFDITDYVKVIDHTEINPNVNGWGENLSAGWGEDTGFGWGTAGTDYLKPFKDLTDKQKLAYFDFSKINYTDKNGMPYNLTWSDTWLPNYDDITFENTSNTASITLTNNNLTDFYISNTLNWYSTAPNDLFKLKINKAGGLIQNEYISIYNVHNKTGFTFKWINLSNSPENILINTYLPINHIFDLDKKQILNSNSYEITFNNSSSYKMLETNAKYKPNFYPNINASNIVTHLRATKQANTNVTLQLQPLNQFYF